MKKLFYLVTLLLLSTSASNGELTLNQRLKNAVRKNDSPKVVEWLKAGATVNEKIDGEWLIIDARSVDVAEQLLAAGARVDVVNKYGRTALHNAVSRSNEGLIKFYLARGILPNCRDKLGLTPLHVAVAYGFAHIVRILLDGGARTDMLDDEGLTAKQRVEKYMSREYVTEAERNRYQEVKQLLQRHALKSTSGLTHGEKWLTKPTSSPKIEQ